MSLQVPVSKYRVLNVLVSLNLCKICTVMHQLGNQLTRLLIVPHPLALLLRTIDVATSNDIYGFVLLVRRPSMAFGEFVTVHPLESWTPPFPCPVALESLELNATHLLRHRRQIKSRIRTHGRSSTRLFGRNRKEERRLLRDFP